MPVHITYNIGTTVLDRVDDIRHGILYAAKLCHFCVFNSNESEKFPHAFGAQMYCLITYIYLKNGRLPEVVHAKEEGENTPLILSVHLSSNRGCSPFV